MSREGENCEINPLRQLNQVRELTWEECLALIPKWRHLVVSVRGMPARDLLEREIVYVGRPMPRSPISLLAAGSPLGNPFPLPKEWTHNDRLDLASRYLRHVLSKKHLRVKILSLTGKTLGCWCSPDLCHAHVLAVLANELPGLPPEFVQEGLERLGMHLRAGNFEQMEVVVRDLAQIHAHAQLPRPELSRAERADLSLPELGLSLRTCNAFEEQAVLTAGQLQAYIVSMRPLPHNCGEKVREEVEEALRRMKLLPTDITRGMRLDTNAGAGD